MNVNISDFDTVKNLRDGLLQYYRFCGVLESFLEEVSSLEREDDIYDLLYNVSYVQIYKEVEYPFVNTRNENFVTKGLAEFIDKNKDNFIEVFFLGCVNFFVKLLDKFAEYSDTDTYELLQNIFSDLDEQKFLQYSKYVLFKNLFRKLKQEYNISNIKILKQKYEVLKLFLSENIDKNVALLLRSKMKEFVDGFYPIKNNNFENYENNEKLFSELSSKVANDLIHLSSNEKKQLKDIAEDIVNEYGHIFDKMYTLSEDVKNIQKNEVFRFIYNDFFDSILDISSEKLVYKIKTSKFLYNISSEINVQIFYEIKGNEKNLQRLIQTFLNHLDEFYRLCKNRGLTNYFLKKIKAYYLYQDLSSYHGYYSPNKNKRNIIGVVLGLDKNRTIEVLIHEFGHLVHFNTTPQAQGFWRDYFFKSGERHPISPELDRDHPSPEEYEKNKFHPNIKFKDKDILPTNYSQANLKESFAEIFEIYMLNPKELSKESLYGIRKFLSLSGLYGDDVKTNIHEIKKIIKEEIWKFINNVNLSTRNR